MPNWCYTQIKIEHKNVEAFKKKIEAWTAHNYCENDFGNFWLGNVVGNSGIDNIDSGEFSISCRGSITSMEQTNDNILIIHTETAWSPALKMWRLLLENYLPGAALTFAAEECGMELYVTNDPSYVGNYIIDTYNEDVIDYMDNVSESNLREYLMDLLHTDETNIEKLLQMKEESAWDDAFDVHKWEEVDPADYE